MFQSSSFEVEFLNGKAIEKVMVCQDPDTTEPLIVYLKVKNESWHQFFLDAGYGIWENWGEIDKDDFYDLIDYTNEFGVKHKIVKRIYCETDLKNSRIIVLLESGERLILKCINPEIEESDCELILDCAIN